MTNKAAYKLTIYHCRLNHIHNSKLNFEVVQNLSVGQTGNRDSCRRDIVRGRDFGGVRRVIKLLSVGDRFIPTSIFKDEESHKQNICISLFGNNHKQTSNHATENKPH